MSQKKKASRAKKKARVRAKHSHRSKRLVSGPALRLAAKQADVRVRRTAQAYVAKAGELELARLERAEADRALGLFYAAQAAKARQPFYHFLAQGDSWFDYTCGYSLIHWLEGMFGPKKAYFENIAASGRLLRDMLSDDFKAKLKAGPGNGATWSAILFAGGGNDICGDSRFQDWLYPYDGGTDPEAYITTNFDQEVLVLKAIYEEAIAVVAKSAKGACIFAHDYDFAIPDGRCVTGFSPHLKSDFHFCFAGPWMYPAFVKRGFHKSGDPAPKLTKDIVSAILKRLANMLAGLEHEYPNQFVLVRTQNILKPIQDPGLWVNELHPYNDSFKTLAQPFYERLRGRILDVG
jgi:hypothetical protein